MSSIIDNRIINMVFNNKQFEQGVKSSISSLDKLNKSLQLDGATKGIENLDKSIDNVDISKLAASVEMIAGRFTNMGIVGVTALTNIANSAINTGKRMVESLTIDPIKMGFDEYEIKMNAIQTILSNTEHAGVGIDKVNEVLEDLNKYADLTIYNFAEMTRNIGTFTAAGIDIDTSAKAIKGIANLAAASGSSSMQASTAMYQLSQALASGKVMLQDWNSVVNAGMGGKLFQDALEKTAESMGHARDKSISFRDSLEDGWITAEVLTKTLEGFAENDSMLKAATQVKTFTQLFDTMQESVQSGWSATWEIIIGNKEEATKFFTRVSDGFNAIMEPMATARNEMLKLWKDGGGRDDLIESFFNIATAIGNLVKPVQEAFKSIFPPMTAEKLIGITKSLRELTEKFKIGDATADKLKRTFSGLFSIVDLGIHIVKTIGSAFMDVVKTIFPMGDGFLSITASLGDFITAMTGAFKSSTLFTGAISGVATVLGAIGSGLSSGFKAVVDFFMGMGNNDTEGAVTFANVVQTVSDVLGKAVSKLSEIMSAVGDRLYDGYTKVLTVLQSIVSKGLKVGKAVVSGIADMFRNLSGVFGGDAANTASFVSSGVLAAIGLGIYKFIKSVKEVVEDSSGFIENITEIFDGVKDCLKAYQEQIKAKMLKEIAIAIAILAGSLVLLATIDPRKLTSALLGMAGVFTELFIFVKMFEKHVGDAKGLTKSTMALIGVATAIAVLAGALKKIGSLNHKEIVKGLFGITVLIGQLIRVSKKLNKDSKGMIKTSISLTILAGALNVMALAVKQLSKIPFSSMGKGLMGIGVLLTELSLFTNNTKVGNVKISNAIGIVVLSEALMVLSKAVENLSRIQFSSMGKALLGMGLILTELSLFINKTDFSGLKMSNAISMVLIAETLVILSQATEKLAGIQSQKLIKALGTMAIMLGEISIFLRVVGKPEGFIKTAIGITILSGALLIIGKAIDQFTGIRSNDVIKGLVGMAGALTILGVALSTIKDGTFAKATGILVTSGALVVLAKSLEMIGNLDSTTLVKGLGSIALLLGELTIALNLMSGTLAGSAALVVVATALGMLVPTLILLGNLKITTIAKGLIALGGALTIIGVASALLSPMAVPMMALAGAIALFGVAAAAVGGAVFAFASALSMLAVSGSAGVAILISALTGIINLIPTFATAVALGVVGIFTTIAENAPTIVQSFIDIFSKMIDGVIEITPKLLEMISTLLTSIIQTIVDMIPVMVQGGMDIIMGFLNGVANNIGRITDAAITIVLTFIDTISSRMGEIIQSALNLVLSFLNGMADAVRNNHEKIRDCIWNIITALGDAVIGFGTDLLDVGKNIIKGVINGFKNMGTTLVEAAKGVVGDAVEGVKKFLGIHSPSRVFAEIGMYSAQGMAVGLDEYSSEVSDSAIAVGDEAVNAMGRAMQGIEDAINGNMDTNPVIRPVMDLSEIQNGNNQLYAMMNANGDYAVNASVNQTEGISRGMRSARRQRDMELENSNPNPQNSNDYSISNVFNITGSNGKEIAEEVSKIIQRQVERRTALWA